MSYVISQHTGDREYTKELYGRFKYYDHYVYDHDCGCHLTIPDEDAPLQSDLFVKIPFPYKQFTDFNFFITDHYGKFISEKYYDRVDDYTIKLKAGSPIGVQSGNKLRFTFCHNKGRYQVKKQEVHFEAKSGSYLPTPVINIPIPQFQPPYNKIIGLNVKYIVFVNRNYVEPEEDYTIDPNEGAIYVNYEYKAKSVDLVAFYTGNYKDFAIADLPMSGYIYLNKHDIDRNYNTNLMAVFINGKLIPRNQILHISNTIYKINKDIKMRYNLEVKSMSPRINSLVPWYKSACTKFDLDIPKQYYAQDLLCHVCTGIWPKKNRNYIDPSAFYPFMPEAEDLITKKKDWYLTLMHHGNLNNKVKLSYTLKFFPDDYNPNPCDINVVLQMHHRCNRDEFEADSIKAFTLGTLPSQIESTNASEAMFSIKISDIIAKDTAQDPPVDNILIRFEYKTKTQTDPQFIYYELDSSTYEDNEGGFVDVFDVVVSTEKNGEGYIYYTRPMLFMPRNYKEIEESIEEGREDE